MSKRVGAITAMVLLSVPAIAAAKDKLDPRAQAMLACTSISANEERLQCYDRSIATLKDALAQGNVVLKEKKAPLATEGIIKASGRSGDESFWIILENGDRWALTIAEYRREPPPPGTPVKLKRTIMGNYWLTAPKWPESEAVFLGHGS
jgi:hypothetical protein